MHSLLIITENKVSSSSFPGAVVMLARFVVALDGFCNCTLGLIQSFSNFPDLLTFSSRTVISLFLGS